MRVHPSVLAPHYAPSAPDPSFLARAKCVPPIRATTTVQAAHPTQGLQDKRRCEGIRRVTDASSFFALYPNEVFFESLDR